MASTFIPALEETTLFKRFLEKLQKTQESITKLLEELETAALQAGHLPMLEDLRKMSQNTRRAEKIIVAAFDLEVEGKAAEADWKTVRHDLRSCNGAILGYAELLQDDLAELGLEPSLFSHKLLQIADLIQEQMPFIDKLKLEEGALYITPHGGLYEDAAEEGEPGTGPLVGKILVIDDDEHKRNILYRRLKKNGHKVFLAENASQGQKILDQESIDLILLDIVMPGVSGTDFLKKLKTSEKFRHIAVLVISSLNDVESVVECIQLGAEDYLPMPFNPILLMARVHACLDKKFLQDQELKKQEELHRLRLQLQAALESIEDGFAVFNLFDEMTICNETFKKLYPAPTCHLPEDYTYKEFLEANYKAGLYQIERRRAGEKPENIKDWIELRMSRHQFAQEPYMEQLSDGRWIEIFERRTPDGGTVSIHKDVTATKEGEDRLKFLAHHDPLTKLPNRVLFEQFLQIACKNAQKSNNKFALLYLDLDNFKQVNDSLGHEFGDHLLIHVAKMMTKALREGDLVARLGGDEFAIVLQDVVNANEAKKMADRILKAVGFKAEKEGKIIPYGMSVGIALYPDDATTVEDLISKADEAMYEAKKAGKGRYCLVKRD